MPLADLADEPFCYLTTTGRNSGQPREIEIWFGLAGPTLYMLAGAGERSHWVRNILREPAVTLRIKDETFAGRGRVVELDSQEDRLARLLLVGKYRSSKDDLASWGRTALPVAIELVV
jgi:deazaflavin-dependent oxidoreductase (nitroreductase family)